MPNYAYRCKDCASDFEKNQPMKDESIPPCPSCELSSPVKKVMTFAGTIGLQPTSTAKGSSADATPVAENVAVHVGNSTNASFSHCEMDGAIVFDNSTGSVNDCLFTGQNAIELRGMSDVKTERNVHAPAR